MQKLIILLVVAVAACAAEQIEHLKDFQIEPSQLLKLITPEIQAKFERILALTFSNYLEGLEIDENIQPKIPVLPIYDDDESPLDSIHIHVANNSGISDWFYGDIHFCNVTIRGLRSIYNNLKIDLSEFPKAHLTFVYKTGEVQIDGLQDTFYNVDFVIPEIIELKSNLRASHEFIFKLTNFSLIIDMTIENILTKINVSNAEIMELKFDRLDINFKNAVHNGVAVTDQDWVEFSALATIGLNGILHNLVRVVVNLFIQPVLHNLLDECTVWHLVLGDYTCIGRPSNDVEKQNVGTDIKSFLMAEISNFVTMADSEICPPEALLDPEATSTPEPTSSTTEGGDGDGDGAEQLTKPILLSLVMLYFLFTF